MRFVTKMIGAKNGSRVPLRVASSFEYSESASCSDEILNRRSNLFSEERFRTVAVRILKLGDAVRKAFV